MEQEFLSFLTPRGVVTRHQQIECGCAFRETAIAAEETDAFNPLAFRLFERAQNAFGFAAGGERDEQVSFLAQAPDLSRKNFIGVVIIANSGHEFAVGGERNGRIGPAILAIAAEEFRGQMRGIGRAAAVAAHEQFVAGGQAGQDHFRRAIQRFIQARQSAKRRD